MMSVLRSTAGYVTLYVLLMLPTYFLPYLGSNSAVLGTVGLATGAGPLPVVWVHLGLLLAMILLTWLRTSLAQKSWVAVLPVLAAVFDMTPGLNFIPLVPTALHVMAIVLGAKYAPLEVANMVEPELSAFRGGFNKRLRNSAIIFGAFTTVAVFAIANHIRVINKPFEPVPASARMNITPSTPHGKPAASSPAATNPGPAAGGTTLPAITSGGFGDLKVGHSVADAARFFGAPIIHNAEGYTLEGNVKCAWARARNHGMVFLVRNNKVDMFTVTSPEYATRSGLRVGDPESKVKQLFGNDPELEVRQTEYGRHYVLGGKKPVSIVIRTNASTGEVVQMSFGSTEAIREEPTCDTH